MIDTNKITEIRKLEVKTKKRMIQFSHANTSAERLQRLKEKLRKIANPHGMLWVEGSRFGTRSLGPTIVNGQAS